MDPKRILIALVVTFIVIGATDYLIHDIILREAYAPGAGTIWRAEIPMSGILISEFLLAIAYTLLWARIVLGGAALKCAIALGVFMGLARASYDVMHHAVQPIPEGLLAKWIIFGFIQSLIIAVVLFFVHKPTKPCPGE